MTDTYSTTDLELAAVLAQSQGMPDVLGDRKKTFVFERSNELMEIVDSYYHKQLMLEPQAVFGTYKQLKRRIYNQGI